MQMLQESSMRAGRISEAGAALISIKPKYAEAILAGRKTVELRRRIPALVPGTRLFIYSTLPVGAVVGAVTLEGGARGTPGEIWDEYAPQAGVERDDYNAYFRGTDEAVGLILTCVQRVAPVTIQALRMLRPGFHPPQVLIRLSHDEARAIQRGGRGHQSSSLAQHDQLSLAS